MKDRWYGVEVCVGLGQVFQNKKKQKKMKDRWYGVEVCVDLGQVFQNKTKKRKKEK